RAGGADRRRRCGERGLAVVGGAPDRGNAGVGGMVCLRFRKRGSLLINAVLGTSLPSDWLEVPHMNALMQPRQAFEDGFVPDAFGAQLLSACHRGHLPEGSEWRVEQLASGRGLVEHNAPAARFPRRALGCRGRPPP